MNPQRPGVRLAARKTIREDSMLRSTRRQTIMGAAATALAASARGASAQTPLKVIVFPGMSNLAQFAALAQGFYTKRGLAVELVYTPNSTELRDGLAAGRYQIAHAGVDNAVAQVETAKVDLFIFMGGNNGFNNLIVQPEIKSYEDFRGKVMAVDAVDTAFAILLYKMLDLKGIKRGSYDVKPVGGSLLRYQAMIKDKTYAASMLNPPFSLQAVHRGLKDFGSAVSMVGPYQSDGGWVLRSWGQANADVLTRYIQANIEGIRFALNPANKAAMVAILADRLKLAKEQAEESFTFSRDGFAVDSKFDLDGFKNSLQLRADMLGTWGGKPPAPDKYLDFTYYQRALAAM
jgi:ABC-type nitrate/sulfonate/bicarbonate transport system substrate-binding protein